MSRRRPNGSLLSLAMTGALLLALTVPVRSGETLASWNEAEVATGTFAAITVPKAVIASCVASNIVIVGARITLTWSFSAAGASTADVVYKGGSSLLGLLPIAIGSGVTTSGPVAGVYTTVFQGGLLSNTLGGPAYVSLQVKGPGTWLSPSSIVRAEMPLLVGPAPCTITNG
jgi:hypothetical protein